MMIALGLSMRADAAQQRRQIVVIGETGTAIAVAAERLAREKAGGRDRAQRAGGAAAEGRAKALRGILDHRDVARGGDFGERAIIGTLAEQVDRDDRAGRSEKHTAELQSLMRTSYA